MDHPSMGVSDTPAGPERLVNARILAELLSISERQVLRLAAEQRIPSIKVGLRSVRFRVSDIMAALEAAQ